MIRAILQNLLFLLLCLSVYVVSAQPLDYETYYKKGKAAHYEGEYKNAKALFLQALSSAQSALGSEDRELIRIINRLAYTTSKLRQNEEALAYYEQAEKIIRHNKLTDSLEMAANWKNKGRIYLQMYQPIEAQKVYEKALVIYTNKEGAVSSPVGNVLMDMAGGFQKMGDYDEAERYYLRAFDIFKKVSAPESQDFNRIYSNLGYLYRKKGDCQQALEFGQKALTIKLKNYKPNHPSVAKYHGNIGKALECLGNSSESIPYFEKALDILKNSLGPDHPQTAGRLGELAEQYDKAGDSEKAITMYLEARSVLKKTLVPDHPYVVANYFNSAIVYVKQQNYAEAESNLRLALDLLENRSYPPRTLIAMTHTDLADLFQQQNQLDSALYHCQLGIQKLSGFNNVSNTKVYDQLPFDSIPSKVELLSLLRLQTEISEAFFQETNKTGDLQTAYKNVKTTVVLIEKMRSSYVSTESKKAIQEATSNVYAAAVRISVKLYQQTGQLEYLWRAFIFSEKNKVGILWNSLMEGNAFANAGLPKVEKEKLALLERNLSTTEEDLIYYENKNDLDRVSTLRAQLFKLKLERKERLDHLRVKYPSYYDLRYAPLEVNTKALVAKLSEQKAVLLEYFYDDESLYLFSVSSKGIHIHQQDLPDQLEEQIFNLREFDIAAYLGGDKKGNESYKDNLFSLHKILIEPAEQHLEGQDKIIIIPHGVLNYLAFETLCPESEAKRFRELDYVLRNWPVQYGWSSALWLASKVKETNTEQSFAGFAPVFNNRSDAILSRGELTDLPNAPLEVRHAAGILEGSTYLAESATEATFREVAPKARVLHLATHALVDDSKPLQSGLAFYQSEGTSEDGFLRTYEIYNLDLNADLAVMNSCDSGHGQLAAGEGVVSLGRAFYYAGCRSVMMSRWPVNDQSSAALTAHLYDNLSKGVDKDVALQQAKLTYLDGADQLTGHPYFWGGLVVYGDVGGVVDTSGKSWVYSVGLGLFFCFLFVLFRGRFF